MKRAMRILCVFCLLAGGLVTGAPAAIPVRADPGTLYVAPGGACGGAAPCYNSIQAAINATVNGDEIRVAEGTYSQTSTGGGVTAVARIDERKIALKGGYTTSNWNTADPDTHPTVIDAQNNGIGIFINYQADIGIGTITVEGLSITGGNATAASAGTDSGGGVLIDHTTHVRVILHNCKIYENTAEDGSGGGIWATRSDNLHITNSEIFDNQGSGIVVTYGDNTVITGNVVDNNAGDGISLVSDLGSNADVSGNEVTDNQGSGINLNTVTGGSLTGNLVSNNHTTGGGGGFDISGAVNNFVISGNTVRGNSALQGGGIDISGSVAEVKNNVVELNYTTTSSNGGGGMYVDAGAGGAYVLVYGNQIISNTTTNQGGGLLVLGTVDVLGNTITGNSASSGGGIIAAASGTIGNNLISSNTAQSGGGIRTVNATGLLLQRNRLNDNRATNGAGGGMNLWGGFFMDVALDGNQVISNTATTKGGGIYLECPTGVDPVDIANTVLAGNLAPTGSGLYSTVCDANIAYNTVAGNRGTWGDGVGLYLRDPIGADAIYTVENTIAVSQTVGVVVESGSATLDATFWGAGDWANDADTGGAGSIVTGTLNYTGDPGFVDPANDDYHVVEDALVVDKGIDTWIATDMDGHPRSAGATDIGADEYVELSYIFLPLVMR